MPEMFRGRLTRSQTRLRQNNVNNETSADSDSDNTTNDMGLAISRSRNASGPSNDSEQEENENTPRDAESVTATVGTSTGASSSSAAEQAVADPPRDEEVLVVQQSDESDNGSDVEFLMETESDDSSGANRRIMVSRLSPLSSSNFPRSAVSPSSSNFPSSSAVISPTQMSRVAQSFSRRPVVEVDLENQINEENDVQVIEINRVAPISIELDSDSDDEVEVDAEVINVDAPQVLHLQRVDNDNHVEVVQQEGNQNASDAVGNVPVNASVDDDNGSDAEQEEVDEDEGPPQKMPRLDTTTEEVDGCHICFEPYDNSGGHRPCCLKCGHIFGKDCIERWINNQKRCPDCNCKAMKKDIRIIYVKNLKALDTAELERMKTEMNALKIEKNKIELTNAQLRCQVSLKTQEIDRLRAENNLLRSGPLKETCDNVKFSEPSTSAKALEMTSDASSSSTQYSGLRMPKLQLIKRLDVKEGQSRVGAYNEWQNLMVVSHAIISPLFPGGSYGIKKINSLDLTPSRSYPVHQKPLRDMAFSVIQNDLLLTVGLDKKAVLFNCSSNCPVQTFNTQYPLWSCCWNSVNQHIFYVGSMNGQVTSYDIRAPQEPVETLSIPTTDTSAVARLRYVPPTYQGQSFNMSGLLIQKLNSVWFSETVGGTGTEPRYHQLPLEGPFLNVDFEEGSRHVLVSTRPKHGPGNQRSGTSHMVCNLGKAYSDAEERDIFSCDIVQVMTGGFQESSVMCRSALFSPQQGQTYVAANGEGIKTVRVWDVANIEQKALLRLNQDAAMDFIHGRVNETKFFGIVTDKSLDVYDIK